KYYKIPDNPLKTHRNNISVFHTLILQWGRGLTPSTNGHILLKISGFFKKHIVFLPENLYCCNTILQGMRR
ncbi:MAG: hypothetical protein KKE44_26575, partial [Proteobacteria bacterium]|nr:hypothetical protein [Pseudomonadota bacterium]MBU1586298.1 hypothetical protein [Pseudomonadota bacterium]